MAKASKTAGPPRAWRVAIAFVTGLLRRLFGWHVEASQPEDRPAPNTSLVVVCNHTSNIDLFLVADTVWRELGHWVRPLGKVEAFRVPVVGQVGRAAGAIPVVRSSGEGREQAYEAAIDVLRDGGTIIVAPEGTITHDGTLLPLRHGAARMALQAETKVLVVTHVGAQRAFSPVAKLPHRGVLVTMAMDLLTVWPDEDEDALTGRIAATMLDRSAQLQAAHPQADPAAKWWPPYKNPSVPTATALDSIERYRS
ncbi:MAG: 1-acyl-sn-glycerol-3-phosphate acyltransferase, partial [Glaciecola sp.]